MAYKYIISKSLDPFFALSIGLAAALTRINREEKEKGQSTDQTIETLKRRVGIMWEARKGS
ncbi:hypothetical protein P154DRAFT_579132 [Amniculicola lignicola CBS 123094]|uniref:Non-classical export protein 1 n=1 Tax=Amniculicola lignicola CBS 123094 TaxID=1392246 RepID=A0A6A5W7W2_9PLEO|nr:hypothetical protein P154DRAFT_579132 [Amniculicola lignicola CBS 123094]